MTSLLTKHIKAEYLATTRMIGNALTLGDLETWFGLIDVFRARLSPNELASLGYAVLKALGPENASLTAKAVLGRLGTPYPPLMSAMDDAAF